MWTCPECGRRFGRTNQGHECLAVVPLDEWYEAEEAWVVEVCRAVLAFVDDQGDDHVVEPAEVGLLIKRRSTVIEVRPRRKWVDVCVRLPRGTESNRFARTVNYGREMTYCVVRATSPADVDDQLCGWMAQSYADAEPAT